MYFMSEESYYAESDEKKQAKCSLVSVPVKVFEYPFSMYHWIVLFNILMTQLRPILVILMLSYGESASSSILVISYTSRRCPSFRSDMLI